MLYLVPCRVGGQKSSDSTDHYDPSNVVNETCHHSNMTSQLAEIAANGNVYSPWAQLKPLFVDSIRQNVSQFAETPSTEEEEMLNRIILIMDSCFSTDPPYTVQRLAELSQRPFDHYKALSKYLRALERVLSVSSTTADFPLVPLAIQHAESYTARPFMTHLDAESPGLLSPIPWATSMPPTPNGITQGELIRSEQENGVVVASEEADHPQAEGPRDINVTDLGPQPSRADRHVINGSGTRSMNGDTDMETEMDIGS